MILCVTDTVLSGVGYHHAGLEQQDRHIIEDLFSQGELPVLSTIIFIMHSYTINPNPLSIKALSYIPEKNPNLLTFTVRGSTLIV